MSGRTAFSPLNIGQHLSILAPGSRVPNGRIALWLERGAFGSGEHETTRHCLEIIETLDLQKQARILDFGSGTGILSIAALLLGAEKAWCVDIEPAAVAACQRNSQLNQLEDQIEHCLGSLENLTETDFDLGLANIYGDILLDVAVNLGSRIRPNGYLLLSGILWEYNFDVRQRYQQLGFKLIINQMHNEFSTLLLQKSAA